MSAILCWFALAVSVPPSEAEITRWVTELGDSRFSVRESAAKKLWQAGSTAEAAVRAAATSKDPETARRAKLMVEKYDWGIFADTAPEIVDAITRFRGGDAEAKQTAIKKLMELGKPGLTTVGRLASSQIVGDDRAIANDAIAGALRTTLPKLLRNDELKAAEDILLACVASESPAVIDDYVAVVIMAGRLPAARAMWEDRLKRGEARATEVAFALARAAGDFIAAKKIAEAAKRLDLVEHALWGSVDWKALAARPILTAQGPGHSPVSELSMTALFHRLAGNSAECDATLERQRQVKPGNNPTGDQLLIAHGLIVNEGVDQAIPLIKKLGLQQELHYLLFSRGDFAAALQAVDPPEGAPAVDRRSDTLIIAAQTTAQLGQFDRAKKIFESLTQNATTLVERQSFVEALTYANSSGFQELTRTQAARYLDAIAHQNIQEIDDPAPSVMSVFLPANGGEAAVWWRYWRQRDANEAPAERLGRVLNMLNTGGATPLTQELATSFLSACPSESPTEKVRWMHALAFAHKCAGQEDLARQLYRQAIKRLDNPANWLKLADFERGQKRYLEAAEAYAKVASEDPTPTMLYLQSRCLADAGKTEPASKIGDMAFRMSAGQFQMRSQLSLVLDIRGLPQEARRERDFVIQAAGGRDDYTPVLLRAQARDAAVIHDYARAAGLFEQCLANSLRFDEPQLVTSHFLVRNARFNHARASLAAGKADQALVHAQACLKLQPNDISVPMHMFAGLVKQGRQQDAITMYRQVADFHRQRLKEFPDSPILLNNMAWLCANCRQDLDEAFAHATRAVKLHEQKTYFDTLAEVCHQRGDKPAAIAAIRKAISLDPGNLYYASQLRRIEAGDRVSLPAEPEE